MPTLPAAALLHMVGYATGATLYAMLLAMLARESGRVDRLARATAILGLTWNVGELLAHLAAIAGAPSSARWITAVAYGALGLLAAVVIHSVSRVRGEREGWRRGLASTIPVVAYGSGFIAALLHLRTAALGSPLPAGSALDVLAAGLAIVSVPLIVVTRRQDHTRRALWMVALAIFAVSALHLSRFHGANESWAIELIGHHASVPLAFAMLYRDYRFALADLFLKRALTLLVLVVVVLTSYVALEPMIAPGNVFAVGLLLVVWIGTVVTFPLVHRGINWFVDRVVLSRQGYSTLMEDLTLSTEQAETEDEVLRRVSNALAPALSASTVICVKYSPEEAARGDIAILTTDVPQYVLRVGPLAGGRRLLSDDLVMLERVAALTARRLDAIRRRAYERNLRALTAEAELKALRAQVHPHFLFNALTTIGYLIQSAPPRALETLMRLTTLLRAVLRSDGEFTSLGRERELIECYLQIERARFEDRLTTRIDVPVELEHLPIPALIVQPLVENAIKHGIAPERRGGHVAVHAELDRLGGLHITVRNTGAPLGQRTSRDGGVGLSGVEQRLHLYYGGAATFSLYRDDDATIAEMTLPVPSDASTDGRTGSLFVSAGSVRS